MIKIQAFQIAENINIKKFRAEFTGQIHSGNNSELFYAFEHQRYLYVLNYGVVVFGGYEEVAKSDFLRFVRNYIDNQVNLEISEDFSVEFETKIRKPAINNERVVLPENSSELAIRIVMFNVAQSVGLEYYEQLSEEMLNGMLTFTNQLEHFGRIKISKKNLLKFIGKTLNIKNSIVDNLYILDDPSIVWDDENLDYLNRNLKELFDINSRFKDLDYRLKIVEDNLKLFSELLQHRENNRLEWIIIALILIEVINLFIKEIF